MTNTEIRKKILDFCYKDVLEFTSLYVEKNKGKNWLEVNMSSEFNDLVDKLYQTVIELLLQEIDKAREEGRRETLEELYAWGTEVKKGEWIDVPEEMTEDRIERARKKREEYLKRFEDTPEEKEELTKEEWFMLKLAVNEIHNKGNGAYDEIGRKIDRLSKLKGKEWNKTALETYKQATQDTTEEWVEGLRKLMSTWGKVLYVNKGRIGKGMQTDMYTRFYKFVKQLLDDREREAYHDGYTDGVTRCMDSLNKLEEDKNEGA